MLKVIIYFPKIPFQHPSNKTFPSKYLLNPEKVHTFATTIPTTLLVRKASAPGWDFVFI